MFALSEAHQTTIRLGVALRTRGDGYEVGGDFYDGAFELGDGK